MARDPKTPRGKRSKRRFFDMVQREQKPSAVQSGHPLKPAVITKSHEVVIQGAAKYFEGAEVEESKETHLIPRQSITRKQFLSILPVRVETEDAVSVQLTNTGRKVTVTDKRVVWRSDRTLLRRNNPFAMPTDVKREGVVRQGANSRKYTKADNEKPSADEEIIGETTDDEIELT